MDFLSRYPVTTENMTDAELLAEATRLETAAKPLDRIDNARYEFVCREITTRRWGF